MNDIASVYDDAIGLIFILPDEENNMLLGSPGIRRSTVIEKRKKQGGNKPDKTRYEPVSQVKTGSHTWHTSPLS